MLIVPATTLLNAQGFGAPVFNALIPNEANYSVHLMQPRGQIEASTTGVRSKDRALCQNQFSAFLRDVVSNQSDLAISPEYSMPWDTLIAYLKAGNVPANGKLWVLGCESIKYSELESLKQVVAGFATLIYEPLQPNNARFLDPLAYIFQAPRTANNGQQGLVILVQFKTFPMGDADHYEINNLQRGTQIYQFGGNNEQNKLVSLICSDAFQFTDANAAAVYDRALIIHIQLNPAPRHPDFSLYRTKLLNFQGNETELICLNWAGCVEEWSNQQSKAWNNVSASAWYLKPDRFDEEDATLGANHRLGMYYTWLKPLRTHALFFNYQPATFLLQASKVAHIAVPGPISPRRGPQLTTTSIWNSVSNAWAGQNVTDDGFSAIVHHSNQAQHELTRLSTLNPFITERILALCAGAFENNESWHRVRELDSCIIDTTEIIRRITFCQDTDPQAAQFRVRRLMRCGHLWTILINTAQLPPALNDFHAGFTFNWTSANPHQNTVSTNGQRSTVIYLGEETPIEQVEAVFTFAASFLQRSASNPDESLAARQRLAVWHRDVNGQTVLFGSQKYNNYSKPAAASEFDIGRES
jgi:hypothetical protein